MSRADRLLTLDEPKRPAAPALKRDADVVHLEATNGIYGTSPPTSAQRLPVLYHTSEAVGAAVDEYADRIAAASSILNEMQVDGEQEGLKVHPALGVLNDPNPFTTRAELFKAIPMDILLNGNAYQFMAGPDGGAPNELWWLNPRLVRKVRNKDNYLLGYWYNVDNIDIPLSIEEVLPFKQLTTLDDLYGIPKLRTAALAADTERAMSEYNRNFFSAGSGVPAGIVSAEDPVNDSDWQRVIDQWTARHGGTQRKTAFIRGKMLSYSPLGLSQRDMDFVQGTQLQIDQVYTAFRTYHLIQSFDSTIAERWFLEGALWPMMRYIAEVFTDQFFTFWGTKPDTAGHLTFSFDDIRPRERALDLEETREQRATLFFNEVREAEGLETIPEWDGILFAHAQQGVAPLAEQPEVAPSQSNTSPDDDTPMQREATQPEDAQERAERRESAGDEVGDDIGAFADKSAIHGELKAWRKVATKDIRRPFKATHIPQEFANGVRALLAFAGDGISTRHVFEVAHKAVAFEWLGEYIAGKAIQATRLEFEDEFADLLAAARGDDINRRRWSLRARTLLRKFGESAYRDGLNDGGVAIEEGEPLSEPDRIELSMLLQSQSQFVTDLGNTLFKGDGVSDAQADLKPEMWFNKSILPMYQAGRFSADKNGMFEWIFNPLKENCITCTRANGQAHRLRAWHASGILPKADTLECMGFECGCILQRTQGAAQGRLAAIPTKAGHLPEDEDEEDRDMRATMPDSLPSDVTEGLRQLRRHIVDLTEDGGEFIMRLQPTNNKQLYAALTEVDIQQGLTLMSGKLQLTGHEREGDDLIVRFRIEDSNG